ncbi:regulatory protein RecX [Brevibacillus ginsengisoli]|uniref:regulatory protein RecX n=1 Tax=Brevibacillus ginsengisoli TaxID=363854 RepID=UPI003CEAE0DD
MRSGVITAVHQCKRNKHRYEIYIEDELAFDVHEDILVKYSLLKGTEIDDSLYHEVLVAEEKHQAYLYALRYIGIRPRTKQQVEKYIISKGYTQERAREACDYCEQKGYLDDSAFARQWVQERLHNKPRGAYAIRYELQQKGVSKAIVEKALQSINQEDEWQGAVHLAIKKVRGKTLPLDAKEEQRILSYLLRKGFRQATIMQIRQAIRSGTLLD